MKISTQYEKLKVRLINQSKSVLRKIKVSKSREITNKDVMILLCSYQATSGQSIDDERKDRLHDALSALKPNQMQVIAFTFFEGLSLRQIGICMGISHTEVSRTLSEALQEIKTRL